MCEHINYNVVKEIKYGNYRQEKRLCKECGEVTTLDSKVENTWNERIGPISKKMSKGDGHCRKCQTTWAYVQTHDTEYEKNMSCSALCQYCWNELTPEERLPYYRELWKDWCKFNKSVSYKKEMKRVWILWKQAVLNEE